MMHRAIIFLAILAAGSTLGMEQAKARLMADAFEAKYASQLAENKESTILHFLAKDTAMKFESDLLLEFIKRGVDVNKKNEQQETPMFIAAQVNRLQFCYCLYKGGAKDPVEPIFKMLIPKGSLQYPGQSAGESPDDPPHNPYDHIKRWFGARWFNEQRKELLLTVILSLRRINLFPAEIQVKIVSHLHKDFIPTYCLSRFFDKVKCSQIREQREEELVRFIRECRGEVTH